MTRDYDVTFILTFTDNLGGVSRWEFDTYSEAEAFAFNAGRSCTIREVGIWPWTGEIINRVRFVGTAGA